MANDDLIKYHAVLTDFWHVFKAEAASMQDTDDWWTKVIQSVHDMSAKYDNCPFALDMARTVINELERRVRE